MEFKERKEWMKIIRPQSQFVKYYRRIALLDEDAERVERSMLIKLDLKQRHQLARSSRHRSYERGCTWIHRHHDYLHTSFVRYKLVCAVHRSIPEASSRLVHLRPPG